MNVDEYLELVAYKTSQDIGFEGETFQVYLSRFDDSYITMIGMEKDVEHLAEREITQELSRGTGFSPKNGKWYGWSHRAIYGFKVGSTCKKSTCHYKAANEKDEIEAAIAFWSDPGRMNVRARKVKDGELEVSWEYADDIPNKLARGQICSVNWSYDTNFGKGEWTAETMEDAKQMAIDFCEGVS